VDDSLLDDLEITTAAQHKALGHPLRHRLLFALGQEPATISRLAAGLGTAKGTVAHHLGVLRDAGLVHVAETRKVRGGTEQYYRRTARRLHFGGDDEHLGTAAALQAVAAELSDSTSTPLATLRNIRLTAHQADSLASEIGRLVEELTDAGPGEARYGILAAVYRPRRPDLAETDPT
jgi:DNA-binding transcriptional ArsR family regulator